MQDNVTKASQKIETSSEKLHPAPDFSANDIGGTEIRLSNYRDEKHVLLVFNRGFT